MENKQSLIIECGEIVKSIITFVRDVRNKHNTQKDKLTLYIDLKNKDVEEMDFLLIQFEALISKYNMGNLLKIEYSTIDFDNVCFETTNINGYNIYLVLPKISNEEQVIEFTKEINRLESQIIKYKMKLSNEKFLLRAPKEVVDSEKKKLSDSENRIEYIKKNLLKK